MIRIIRLEQIEWSGVLCEVDGKQTMLFEGTHDACAYVLNNQIADHLQTIAWIHRISEWSTPENIAHKLRIRDYKMTDEYASALVSHWLDQRKEPTQ